MSSLGRCRTPWWAPRPSSRKAPRNHGERAELRSGDRCTVSGPRQAWGRAQATEFECAAPTAGTRSSWKGEPATEQRGRADRARDRRLGEQLIAWA